MATESRDEGVEGVVVDGDDGDGGRETWVAAVAGQDGDLEVGVEKLLENGGAEVAGSLG